MTDQPSTPGGVYAQEGAPENYGLHAGALGPIETLAQSVSAMAPSTSSSLTIPLVFALAGNGTWFVYLVATGAILLVGFCVSSFTGLAIQSPGVNAELPEGIEIGASESKVDTTTSGQRLYAYI